MHTHDTFCGTQNYPYYSSKRGGVVKYYAYDDFEVGRLLVDFL